MIFYKEEIIYFSGTKNKLASIASNYRTCSFIRFPFGAYAPFWWKVSKVYNFLNYCGGILYDIL